MISQALTITAVGMGGVFGFLIMLIGGMTLLRLATARGTHTPTAEKIAAAIALAKRMEE